MELRNNEHSEKTNEHKADNQRLENMIVENKRMIEEVKKLIGEK